MSRPLEALVAEATRLVELGALEIVLIGQDITAYGRDLETDETLADVVRAVAAVPGVRWLRLMYAQPDGVTDELLAAMAENANVCRYLDMPLQHASKLRAPRDAPQRRRRGLPRAHRARPSGAARRRAAHDADRRVPRRDTRRRARRCEDFLERARFDYVGVFVFSPEDGTTAAELPDQVPLRTRRARAQRLRDIADRIGFERAADRVGERLEVLVEGVDEDDDVVVGRWRGQAPEIDGLVLLDRGEPGEIVTRHHRGLARLRPGG